MIRQNCIKLRSVKLKTVFVVTQTHSSSTDMKKLLFSLIIFSACKSPDVKPAAQKDVRPAEVVVTREESNIIPADERVTEVSKEDLVKNTAKPPKQNNATTSSTTPGNFTKSDEIKQEQKSADSTLNTDPGGGSDFEGYIPFIKQFFDR